MNNDDFLLEFSKESNVEKANDAFSDSFLLLSGSDIVQDVILSSQISASTTEEQVFLQGRQKLKVYLD